MSALTNSPYTQNYDSLANTSTSSVLPTDWFFIETGTNADTTYNTGTGSNNAGNTYSFGASGSTERALGSLLSGSLVSTIGAKFENATGSLLTSLLINYTGEQWRIGTLGRLDKLDFQYSVNASSLSTGTWIDFDALDFIAPTTTGTTGALDGNAAANRTVVSASITGLTLANGDSLWIRWNDFNASGADDALAIDNFSISVPTPAIGKMEITEYMYGGTDGEFIEFTNVGNAAVNMSGWSFDDDSRTAGTVDLSAFGVVQPGESVILTEATASNFRAAWGLAASTKIIGNLTTNLGRNDEINLFDNTNTLVDRLTYGDQNVAGTVRAQNASAWAPGDQLVEQTIDSDWKLSVLNDSQLSHASSGGDLGNPGIYDSSTTVIPGTPTVNLTLSSSSGSEANASAITITATASAILASAQSVKLDVSGLGITSSDYFLSNTTITIAAGQSSASVVLTIADDATSEGNETAVLSLVNPSAGLTLGNSVTQNLAITNNDGSFLTKIGGAASANGAEIPAFDPASKHLFVIAGPAVEVYAMNSSGGLALSSSLALGFTLAPGTIAVANSVAVKNGVVAVGYAVVNSSNNSQALGHVSFYDANTGAVLNDVKVGYLPDMVTFTPDGSKVLVANEGEPNSYNQADSFDPEGSVSIIDLASGVAAATVQEVSFTSFNSQIADLKAAGVRIFGPNATVAQDLEPEYISITPDGSTAMVTLQENNAFAKIDIATATVISIIPLGTKNFNAPGNGFDASDRDVDGSSASGGKINIQNWPVQGMYQPDAIANFTINGHTYYITGNEGDSRDYNGFSEEVRVGDASYVLDPTIFPDAATLKLNQNLGRLQLTNASGDTDGDGDIDVIMAFGARSFSIWDESGAQVYDSGDAIEQITAARTPALFNSDGLAASFESRSDNKGPEPEGVTTGIVGGRTYAFVGLERVGDIMVFDVSNPTAPQFVQYINTPEDVAPEGMIFISAADSPTGKPLLVTTNEVSKTVAVFEIKTPVRIADIQGTSHISPMVGQGVQDVVGKVTAIASNGFWIQDPQPDNNPATSDGIFIFTTNAAILSARSIGEAVKVSGTVSEFRPGGDASNLTITEIGNGVQPLAVTAWTDAPAGDIAPIILGVDRIPPTHIINNDFVGSGNVETGGDFDPANEGIDFYESLEGMLVQVNNPVAVSPTNNFGEIWVLANNGAGATSTTAHGGSLVTASDFNPERIQIDNLLASQVFPQVDVGAKLNNVVGVVDYSFNNYEVRTLSTPTVAQASTLQKEVTTLTNSANQLTLATFNVENLDPSDGATKFNNLATAIVNNLQAPDIINLEEVQDNNGATNNGIVDANVTLQTLIDAIVAAGGPTYAYQQINPSNNQDGGEPGGNIRVAFLYNPARVSFVENSLLRLTDTNLADGDAFASSRKPLVGTFVFNGEEVTVIGNHFNSKGGDDPLFGPTQAPVLGSEVQRNAQAEIVSNYVESLVASKPGAYVIVAGDLNDFEFSAPITRLKTAGLNALIETLPANERYTYNYEGNVQTLDHILASNSLMPNLSGYDVVHINSEFATQVSDHDPVLARFDIYQGHTISGNSGRNILVGGAGNDIITGLQGRDQLTGGAGADKFVYTSLLDAGDVITDFQVGLDHLDIDLLLASVGYTGSNAVLDGYLGLMQASGKTVVTFDADGSAGAGAARVLVELLGVTAPDYASALLA